MDGVQRGLAGCEQDDNTDAFGYWRCKLCNSKFFDGPRAIHNLSCPDATIPKKYFDVTYRNCIRVRNNYVFDNALFQHVAPSK